MFEHVRAAIRQFANKTARSLRRKRHVVLELMNLEERATPAADMLFSVDPPDMLTVAELAPTKPIVRIDLVPFSCATKTDNGVEMNASFSENEDVDDLIVAKEQPSTVGSADPGDESNTDEVITSEEDLLAAKLNEALRQMASVGV